MKLTWRWHCWLDGNLGLEALVVDTGESNVVERADMKATALLGVSYVCGAINTG